MRHAAELWSTEDLNLAPSLRQSGALPDELVDRGPRFAENGRQPPLRVWDARCDLPLTCTLGACKQRRDQGVRSPRRELNSDSRHTTALCCHNTSRASHLERYVGTAPTSSSLATRRASLVASTANAGPGPCSPRLVVGSHALFSLELDRLVDRDVVCTNPRPGPAAPPAGSRVQS